MGASGVQQPVRIGMVGGGPGAFIGGVHRMALALLHGEGEVEDMKAAYVALGMEILSAPSMLVLPAQEGKMSVGSEIAYVSDWSMETIEPGGQVIADPTVEVLGEGLELDFRVWQLDMNGFGIEVGIDYSEVERPIEVSSVTVESGGTSLELEVSNPYLLTTSVEAAVRMPDGSGLRLFAPSEQAGGDIVILLTFEQVDIDDQD